MNNNFFKIKDVKSKLIKESSRVKNPLFSIIIPTYKREMFLKEALESALNQEDFYDYEIIIVDNENIFEEKTKTEELLEKYDDSKIFYYKNEKNIGMVGNWNRCIELSKGEWIVMLHDDDMLKKNYLKEIYKIITKNKNIAVITNNSEIIRTPTKKTLKEKIKRKFKNTGKIIEIKKIDMYMTNRVIPAGVCFRKKYAIELKGFDDTFYPSMDYYFWVKMLDKGKIYFYDLGIAYYRLIVSESLKFETRLKFALIDWEIRKEMNSKNNFFLNYLKKIILNIQYFDIKENFPERREEAFEEIKRITGEKISYKKNIVILTYIWISKLFWILKIIFKFNKNKI